MARIFTGPVELSEYPTNRGAIWVGSLLKFYFQVKKTPEIIENPTTPVTYIFPTIRIGTKYVETWMEWQQHEVRINDYLVGTIRNLPEMPSKNTFIFKFQPKILKVHEAESLEKVPQDKINFLTIEMGTGGLGLNDSFTLEYIELENVETNFT